MKTKTATINIYHMHGTKNGYCADVTYRGKLLVCFDGQDITCLENIARIWARNRSFTHSKVVFA